MKACPTCGRPVAQRAKFCASCGAALSDATPADPTPPAVDPGTDVLASPYAEPPAVPEPAERTVVERVLGGDWRPAAFVAAATVAAAAALSLLFSIYLAWTGGDEGLQHSALGFFRAAAQVEAMAFGSPLFISSNGDGSGTAAGGMAPLTVTVLVVFIYVGLLRRHLVTDTVSARIGDAVRSAIITSLGLALLSLVAWNSQHFDSDSVKMTTSPGRIFGWSLLLFTVVGLLAAARPWEWLATRAAANPTHQRLFAAWQLPVQGALVSMATGVALGGVTAIVIFFAEADGGRLDVVKALPLLLAFFVNLGVDMFTLSVGAGLHAAIGGSDGGSATVSLFDRHGLSPAYFALLLLPIVSIAAGAWWMHHRRDDADPYTFARACYRMALPAAILYVVLALPSRAGFHYSESGGPTSGGHAGPQILLGVLIVAAWFLVLGFAAGRYLLPRPAAEATVRRGSRWYSRSLPAVPVAIGALAVAVVVGVVGVVTADDNVQGSEIGPFGDLFFFGAFATASSSSVSEGGGYSAIEPAQPTLSPPAPAIAGGNAEAALFAFAAAEETYYTDHGSYTSDESSLDVFPVPAVTFTYVRADDVSWCAEASDQDSGTWSYGSDFDTPITGSAC